MDHQFCIDVSAAGDTVWVTGHDGTCVGRFSKRFGIDVHRTVADQVAGADQCLYCTHGASGKEDWRKFCAAVSEHHAIDVPFDTIQF